MFAPLLLLLATSVAVSRATIPKRVDGFVYGGSENAQVLIEAYLDPLCPYSKLALPVAESVVQYYNNDTSVPDKVRLVVHLFTLPYHFNSWRAAQVAHAYALNEGVDSRDIFNWIDLVYANLDSFGRDPTATFTFEEVKAKYAGLAGQAGLNSTFVTAAFADPAVEQATRDAFKLGASRGVSGTPTFHVNGIPNPLADSTYTLENWQADIDPLLQ
eukprot:TRINITY_DN4032_c0_g1_i1.p2 TRINITY_DN4032_c0_g1~~TRINITY_DN4032_c0_g1_i1.p2  ORF type:complete len:215 (-),score=71.48 TRINITY_DN4032_c0_g1_i1:29-673(-)